MILYPAIDVYEGKAVRLVRGDYRQMTVYSDDICAVAASFRNAGATHLHMVDLEGARTGSTPNFDAIVRAAAQSGLFAQVGGGIRTHDAVQRYLDAGVGRVILGTAAAREPSFLAEMLARYGERIAVGVDIKDGFVATHGWTQTTSETCEAAFARLGALGVKTAIVTDVSRDGMLAGANIEMYRALAKNTQIALIASGGVSQPSEVAALRALGLHGTILGKALYENRLSLKEAIEKAGDQA
ncbi:MAG: 1-(5-phosphoribosyl)-5-[(5-phosphoribosylamino)methylideneamino]imidazole-4-carboxamide isomerase [Christensenellales bacterium]|jgi:phosphoribosylformimino-5-aminoimidazole carboxamide ribotide isomerase